VDENGYREVEWTEEKISRFWSFISKQTDTEYSGEVQSQRLIKIIKKRLPRNGNVLDIGFGTGKLLTILYAMNYSCYGFELSEDTSSRVNFPDDIKVGYGSITNIPFEERFDVVFATDVLEHLPSKDWSEGLIQIRNHLTDSGIFIATTPADERREDQFTICPECRAVFHIHQHIHSWDEGKIIDVVNKAGLKIIEFQRVKEHKITRSFVDGTLLGLYNLLKKKGEKEVFVLVAKR